MLTAVFSSDPVLAEGIGSVLRESGGHNVVLCGRHLGELEALAELTPDVVIATEEFDSPIHRLALAPLHQRGAKLLLLVGAGVGTQHDSKAWDAIVDRRQGTTVLLAAVQRLDRARRAQKPAMRPAQTPPPAQKVDLLRLKLTAREEEAAILVAGGHRNKEIARILGTSEQNIKGLVQRAMRALDCKSRVELALLVSGQKALEPLRRPED